MYRVVFVRGDKLPQDGDFSEVSFECLTVAQAAKWRAVTGDLVVHAGNKEIVTNDLSWLWQFELDNPDCYVQRMIQKQRMRNGT